MLNLFKEKATNLSILYWSDVFIVLKMRIVVLTVVSTNGGVASITCTTKIFTAP